jgi:hypothetical protein
VACGALHGQTFAVGDIDVRKGTAVLSGQKLIADFDAANPGAVDGALPRRRPPGGRTMTLLDYQR